MYIIYIFYSLSMIMMYILYYDIVCGILVDLQRIPNQTIPLITDKADVTGNAR